MKVTEQTSTVIKLEPGDAVRDLYNAIGSISAGRLVSVMNGAIVIGSVPTDGSW